VALISQEGFTLRLGIPIFESDSLIYPYVQEQLFLKGVHRLKKKEQQSSCLYKQLLVKGGVSIF
jgi:hypothetical protein